MYSLESGDEKGDIFVWNGCWATTDPAVSDDLADIIHSEKI